MAYERRAAAGWSVHPGEILKLEFLKPHGISGYALAKQINVPPQAVNDIVLKKRGISAEMALRLSRFFRTSEEFWMNLQSAYELATARSANRKSLKKIRPLGTAA